MFLLKVKDSRRHQYNLLLSEKVDTINFGRPKMWWRLQISVVSNADTTKFCDEKANITNFNMKKGETMNFCNAKKQTLQSCVMRKDIANFCSPKQGTLQSFVVPKSGHY